MNRSTLTAILVSSFVVLGCDKSGEQKAPDPAAQAQATAANTANPANPANPATPTTAATPAATEPVILDSDLVTAADFEEEATKAITAKNYKTELASLETEVSKE